MTGIRAVIASPDPDIRARAAQALEDAGHTVVRETASVLDALQDSLEDGAELAVLDEALSGFRGSEIALILRHLRFRVTVVVLQPDARARDQGLLTLDPTDEGFEDNLVSIADRLGTAS